MRILVQSCILFFIFSLVPVIPPAFAQQTNNCVCTQFPFKPNPPCNKTCLERIVADPKLLEPGKVEGLDSSTYNSLFILANRPKGSKLTITDKTTSDDLAKFASFELKSNRVMVVDKKSYFKDFSVPAKAEIPTDAPVKKKP